MVSVGYGIPGPKGEKGDAGFSSSSGTIQNINFCFVLFLGFEKQNGDRTEVSSALLTGTFYTGPPGPPGLPGSKGSTGDQMV